MNIVKRYIKGIKMIKESEVLTKQEKKEYIIKGTIEEVLNSWKLFAKLPFAIVGITLCTIGMLFSYVVELLDLLEQVFRCIVQWIDDRQELTLTKGQTRDKLIKEIKEKNIKKIY